MYIVDDDVVVEYTWLLKLPLSPLILPTLPLKAQQKLPPFTTNIISKLI